MAGILLRCATIFRNVFNSSVKSGSTATVTGTLPSEGGGLPVVPGFVVRMHSERYTGLRFKPRASNQAASSSSAESG